MKKGYVLLMLLIFMDKKIIEWNQSNIEVTVNIWQDEYKKFEQNALREMWKDINIPWFRVWHAPLEEIKKRIDPRYLDWAIYETIVNNVIWNLIKEKKYNLIWNIYDFNASKKDNTNIEISFKIDIYPEVKIKNNNYEAVEPKIPDFKLTDKELKEAIDRLKKQFADYIDDEKINIENSSVKLELEYLDDKWNKVWEWKIFIWKEDFDEFDMLKNLLSWKEKWFSKTIEYNENKLPKLLRYFKKDKDQLNIKNINIIVSEIKKVVLPEINIENLEKWFWKKYNKIEEFMDEIKKTLELEKKRTWLAEFVNDLLLKIKDSFDIVLPKTLIDQEIKQRLESLKQRYWWEQNFEKMLKSMKPEDVRKLYDDITNSSKESIKNFLILMKFAELKWIADKIDFKKDLDFEEKLLNLFENNNK